MTALTLDLGALTTSFTDCTSRLEREGFAEALWNRRLDVWTRDASVQQKIGTRLGWLGALEFAAAQRDRLRAVADLVAKERPSDIVLLGMGGSSLAPEVLRGGTANERSDSARSFAASVRRW